MDASIKIRVGLHDKERAEKLHNTICCGKDDEIDLMLNGNYNMLKMENARSRKISTCRCRERGFQDGVIDYYDKDILGRVRTILYLQMRKYEYLFDRG